MARWLLAHSGLPRVPGPPVGDAQARSYEQYTAEHLDQPDPAVPALDPPGPLASYLPWLAAHRPVLFHGSKRGALTELSTTRESRDATAFGDQTAVFASDDPVWALFFAVVRRGEGVTSLRNGAVSIVDRPAERRYFMSINDDVPAGQECSDGWLYVVPRNGFVLEPARFGVLYTSHWVATVPVVPLGRFAVTPADFPLPITRHARDDSVIRTLWQARHH